MRMDILDSGALRKVPGGQFIVSRDDTRPDAEPMQLLHRLRRVRPQGISKPQETDGGAIACDCDDSQSFRFQFTDVGPKGGEIHAFPGEKVRVPRNDLVAIEPSL